MRGFRPDTQAGGPNEFGPYSDWISPSERPGTRRIQPSMVTLVYTTCNKNEVGRVVVTWAS